MAPNLDPDVILKRDATLTPSVVAGFFYSEGVTFKSLVTEQALIISSLVLNLAEFPTRLPSSN